MVLAEEGQLWKGREGMCEVVICVREQHMIKVSIK